jgi:deazaflavin-dependent oxidoreductase (nitroreductase family)
MTYPRRGTLYRILYKIPLVLWRLGFGSYLSHPARGGSKMLVLTARGRKSGLPRHTMLSYILYDGKEYVVSGWGERSDWVKNIQADPMVTIQAGGKIYSAHASRLLDPEEFKGAARSLFDSGGDSHFEDWLDGLGIDQNLEDLLEKQDRVYLMGFERVEEDGPDPLPADLLWIWAVLFSLLLGFIFFVI